MNLSKIYAKRILIYLLITVLLLGCILILLIELESLNRNHDIVVERDEPAQYEPIQDELEKDKSSQDKPIQDKPFTVAEEQPQLDSVIPDPLTSFEDLPSVGVVATGYYAGIKSTGKTPDHPQYGITYSGVKVRRDVYSTIAADPKVFPLGTILYIPDYGYGVVADTGSAIKGKKIDLYFETLEDVYKEWGKRQVDVFVVKEGNGKVTEAMLDELNKKTFRVAQKEYVYLQ